MKHYANREVTFLMPFVRRVKRWVQHRRFVRHPMMFLGVVLLLYGVRTAVSKVPYLGHPMAAALTGAAILYAGGRLYDLWI